MNGMAFHSDQRMRRGDLTLEDEWITEDITPKRVVYYAHRSIIGQCSI